MKAIDVLFDWYPRVLRKPQQGVVVKNDDPQKMGRVKARIPLYGSIDVEMLPWCYPLVCSNRGVGRTLDVPKVGDVILVFFPYLDIHFPYYFPVHTVGSVPGALLDNYPQTYGVADHTGIFFRVNTQTREVMLQHCSGAYFKIDCKGRITVYGKSIKLLENPKLEPDCCDGSGNNDGDEESGEEESGD